MFSLKIVALIGALFSAATAVSAETHTITFTNKCGRGTPTLVSQTGQILSRGGTYTHNGPLIAAIAYLQTGQCLLNGEHCTMVETTLRNPPSPGAGSSTDISLIPPHQFNVEASFAYRNGCDGQGKDCASANCPPTSAFHKTDDYGAQVQCQTNNVNLHITFCGKS